MLSRVLFIGFTIASLFSSASLISLGLYEMSLDQKTYSQKREHKDQNIIITHVFIALLIFLVVNTLIVCHVVYITYYVIKGHRYKWHVSWHYFCYIVLEIISVVCIIGKYDNLVYGLELHIMTAILAVLLFFFNCFSVQIHQDLEYAIREKQEETNWRKIVSGKTKALSCVRIDLHIPLSNLPQSSSDISTMSNRTTKKPGTSRD